MDGLIGNGKLNIKVSSCKTAGQLPGSHPPRMASRKFEIRQPEDIKGSRKSGRSQSTVFTPRGIHGTCVSPFESSRQVQLDDSSPGLSF